MENNIDNTGNQRASASDTNFLDLLIAYGQHLRILIIIPIMMGGLSLFITKFSMPLFTAKTVFLPPVNDSSSIAQASQLGDLAALAGLGSQKGNTDRVVSFLKSNSLLDALIEQNDLKNYYQLSFDKDLRDALMADTKIEVGTDGLITLSYTARDPTMAAEIANEYVLELKNLSSRLAFTEAQRRKKFFEDKLLETQQRLDNALTKLKSSGLDKTLSRVYPQATLQDVQQIQGKLAAKEIQMQTLETYLAKDSVQLLTHKSELNALRKQLEQLLGTAEPMTDSDVDYLALYRHYNAQEKLYNMYFSQLERANVDVSREGGFIQIIDPAYPPQLRSSPQRKKTAIYTSLVTGFAILFFILIKFMFTVIRNQGEDTEVKLGTLKRTIANQFFLR